MHSFRVTFPNYSDYEFIRRNGLLSGPGTLGFEQNLKKLAQLGRLKPEDPGTILAELYSPQVDDFLHGMGNDVPFLVSEKASRVLLDHGLTGFRLGPVEIVKIATKGRVQWRGPSGRGEPEDLIEKPSNKIGSVPVPVLHAVHVTGSVGVIPDKDWAGDPRYVPAFSLPAAGDPMPDLWRPRISTETRSEWTFCSARFKGVVARSGLTNIRFIQFKEFMKEYGQGHSSV